MQKILQLTCSLPLLLSSSWVDTSLINFCGDRDLSYVTYFYCFSEEHRLWTGCTAFPLLYITLTIPIWNCQAIFHYTFQFSRVFPAATMSPFLSSGHKSSPQKYACGTIALVLTPAACRWHKMRGQNAMYGTLSCVSMKEVICSGWMCMKDNNRLSMSCQPGNLLCC